MLDTTLAFGLNVRPLEKFKGNLYLDGTFSPYDFKMGAYLLTSKQKEKISCPKKRELGTIEQTKN